MQTQPTATAIDSNDVFRVLSEPSRRTAIKQLAENASIGEPVSFDALAEAIAAEEHECKRSEVTSEQHEHARIQVYQRHSTVLDAIADVDHDEETISPTARTVDVWRAYSAFQQELSD